ncbi:carboxypeptidase-like regulatory domain-containing protein [Flavobacterium sp. LS1R49]|uniref:Carboxypeptidase-like regulatory domain-containing protein n=1 Tax=Flavobacterium shii TaxID=2987687 RepID=A0A9X2YVN8_9FLAO|nr:carboxypeptidase-like regulatory domain-containing protein [Flavobacterium shii]MCV9928414.1 carboxypeptidase-like regulatory domain-containing protein [Flavobacterium shii]
MNKVVCVFFVFLANNLLAQVGVSPVVKGKVDVNAMDLEGIYVVNLKTEASVVTDAEGVFAIPAKIGDTLVFSSVQFKERRVILTDENFVSANFSVRMEPAMNQLREVIIKRYDNINAVALGIIPAGQRSYTAAERKLKAATSLDPTATAGTMAGGSISADPLLNLFSGRSKMLKKELAVEKKEIFMQLLENMFDTDHFVRKLSIPVDYVKGFEYFAIENESFTKILNSKNKTTTEFLLGELAVKYKEIIARENN